MVLFICMYFVGCRTYRSVAAPAMRASLKCVYAGKKKLMGTGGSGGGGGGGGGGEAVAAVAASRWRQWRRGGGGSGGEAVATVAAVAAAVAQSPSPMRVREGLSRTYYDRSSSLSLINNLAVV
jgi:hypothetical protein